MRSRTAVLAAMLAVAPVGARAADLVVWWEESYTPAEDAAVRELIAAFEHKTGKQVELVRHDADDQTAAVQAAIEAGRPPDFLFGEVAQHQIPRWAEEGRLVDLSDTIGSLKDLFDADTLELSTLRNARDGGTALYAMPMARDTTHIHVWKSLLEQAGLMLGDISPGSGMPFGHSGATGRSQQCVRPWAATTSGEPGWPCRPARSTRGSTIPNSARL